MKRFPALQIGLLASLLMGAGAITQVRAQAHDMFPTKAAAEQRARQLRCTGAFAMGNQWMPCKDLASYEKALGKPS